MPIPETARACGQGGRQGAARANRRRRVKSSGSGAVINADLSAGGTTQMFSKYGALDDIALVKYLDKTSQQLKDGVLVCELANKKLTLIGDGAAASVIGSTTAAWASHLQRCCKRMRSPPACRISG